VKTLKVAFHLFQNDDGSGNFSLSNPEHLTYLENVEMVVNQRLANLGPLNIGNSPYIMDSRVRIDVVAMYEHRNTAVVHVPNAQAQYNNYVVNDASAYGLTNEDIGNVEHILLAGEYEGSGCCGGRKSWRGEQGWIILDSWFEHYLTFGFTSFSWTIPGHFIHELGHAMNLPHNYTLNNNCDGCTDNDAIPGGPCPSLGMSNNYMDSRADGTPGAENGYNASDPDPGFSACQLGIVHHALEGNIPSRTIWRVVRNDHCVRDPNATIVVSGSHVWTDSKKLHGDLIITSGSTLTVKCRIHMPAGAKVIVQPGARLIVDEGHFTNLCGEFWSGIEVWGTTNQHQFPSNNPTHQGLLVLKNGAIIEHAREGFTNWKPGDWNSIGGVIQVQGTPGQIGGTFLNSRRAAGFMAYQNFHPGNPNIPRPNNSYFNYAHFKVDPDYRGGNDFHDHVSMWKVDGIQFRACTFENAQNNVPTSTQLGRGIYSIDADYIVTGNCTALLPVGVPCPAANLDHGAFIGLGHGIDARSGGTGRGFTVRDCRFQNNVVGVYTEGLTTFSVIRNDFTVGDRDVELDGVVDDNFQEGHHRGVSTQTSHGFRIEENRFDRAANTTAEGVSAIVIENSRENNTQVYKNDAFNMDEGYIGEGRCMDFMQASSIGHQFICNTNSGNGQNFWVRTDDGLLDPNLHSIRTQQGSDPVPAGNTFDQDQGVPLESDYKNETAWVINYWHGGGQTEPWDITPGWLGKTLATGTNGCPSRLSGREVRVTPGLQEQVGNELQAAKAAYISTVYVFNTMLDGGNTDAVVDEVQQSWPSEAWELRQYLLSKSPYLSTEVLKEMMVKNTLPQAMVLEICLANPEATKKEGFTRWAEYEAPAPLPSYMIDLIAGSWAPKTFRMQLEAQMGQHHADMSVAADILQDALRSDDEAIHPAEALAVWQQLPNYGARYGEIAARLRMNDFDGARVVLNNLQNAYPMKEDREAERDRTLWYVDQLAALSASGRHEPELTEAEIAQWQAFALAASDIPGTWAGNVLCFFHEVCIGRGDGPSIGNKSLRPTVAAEANAEPVVALSLLPNPASTWVTVAYELTGKVENAFARIMDAGGREVAMFTIANTQGQHVWDTRQVPAGVYSVELFNIGLRVETKRLVVQPQN
jgi:hypothetical protein